MVVEQCIQQTRLKQTEQDQLDKWKGDNII